MFTETEIFKTWKRTCYMNISSRAIHTLHALSSHLQDVLVKGRAGSGPSSARTPGRGFSILGCFGCCPWSSLHISAHLLPAAYIF